ncbi:MAG: carbohydrate ABC transporter permease [Anaerolineae bacterium]
MATDTPLSATGHAAAPTKVRPGLYISWVTVATYLILSLGAILMVFPFVWMTLSAFKQPSEIITYPPTLFPASPSLDLLTRVWTEIDFKRYFANSLFLAITVTAIQLLTSSFVGYVLAKYQFWGRSVFFIALLSTMMIPWPVLLIPQYLIVLRLGLINTYWAIILPALYSTFGIFLMRQYMHSIPDELIDAARIDGAAEPDIFVRIILPMCGPVLAALGIFTFMGSWDSFIWPLVVLSKESMYTLPLGLAMFNQRFWTDYAAVNAGAFISVIPVIIVFLLLQRRFIEGIALTGLKG